MQPNMTSNGEYVNRSRGRFKNQLSCKLLQSMSNYHWRETNIDFNRVLVSNRRSGTDLIMHPPRSLVVSDMAAQNVTHRCSRLGTAAKSPC